MKAALFGCGRMGLGCAYALATDPATTRLTVVDLDLARARETARRITPLASCPVVAIDDPDAARTGQDVLLMALPWAATRVLITAAAHSGIPVASITRPQAGEM